jgi:hypothetical protein
MFETILFSWILEWTKDGVKSQVVLISKSQIFINLSKYITPVLLIIIFLGSLFKPLGNNGLEMFLVFLVETDGH